MQGMIFIDSNIPMYLIGAEHPLKVRSHELVDSLVRMRRRLVTSAGVLQEICHRYSSQSRREWLQSAFDTVHGIVDQIFPVTPEDVVTSKDLLLSYTKLSARDALHASVMKNLGIEEIATFDSDFDQIPWVTRVS